MACCFPRTYVYPDLPRDFRVQSPVFGAATLQRKYRIVNGDRALYRAHLSIFTQASEIEPVYETLGFAYWCDVRRFVLDLDKILRFDVRGYLDRRRGVNLGYRVYVSKLEDRELNRWIRTGLPFHPDGWERTNLDVMSGVLRRSSIDVPTISDSIV